MRTIKDVIFYTNSNELEIRHINGYLGIQNTKTSYYKAIKIGETKIELNNKKYKHYNSFSKNELIMIQNILLLAYVFLNDQIDEVIKNSESMELLEEIKCKIISLRKHLRFITNNIENYEELLKEYKDI
ncbi:hypothetical protein QWY81_13265 [Polaribacter undariae]|uniref:Uncharacterized protein n=1 Tax=Polaribacter sejongensis TaxID=985043 RepID=A0AAJ1QYG1_9FLAO|nr:hypothetical protein [Polaribacter undariae]MDN3620430.1 hypothetical protein [Polaribacter undariae]UWD32829.1 hypothetical protein NQP51_03915 [Polaribacter undariae]